MKFSLQPAFETICFQQKNPGSWDVRGIKIRCMVSYALDHGGPYITNKRLLLIRIEHIHMHLFSVVVGFTQEFEF